MGRHSWTKVGTPADWSGRPAFTAASRASFEPKADFPVHEFHFADKQAEVRRCDASPCHLFNARKIKYFRNVGKENPVRARHFRERR